ncbi:MAG: M20/M25/M40 family metallo-hydrolase [Oligoflexales bacterium]
MVRSFLLVAIGFYLQGCGNQDVVTVTTDFKAWNLFQNNDYAKVLSSSDGEIVGQVLESDLPQWSATIHEKLNRCGGFFLEGAEAEGLGFLALSDHEASSSVSYRYPEVEVQEHIAGVMNQVQEASILEMIEKLSAFQNRYYRSQYGVQSQTLVMDTWKELAKDREDISVEMISHRGFPQPSVVLTIEGTKRPNEVVVLGGHGDSIAGWMPDQNVDAPGADDNASGIATLTEVLRRVIANDYHPERTVQVMSYAAEEVGLVGSARIAAQYEREQKQVVGVLQFDMTNFSGSVEDVVLMTDHTNPDLTRWTEDLLNAYQPDVEVGRDQCGYACSDHASWTRYGYPSVMPFESRMDDHSPHIHTNRDTLDRSDASAGHAKVFAKLGVTWMMELAAAKVLSFH